MPHMPEPTRTDTESPATPPDAMTLKASLDALREELTRMSASEIEPAPGLDASAAAGIAVGSLPRIVKQRDAIESQFGAAGAAHVDLLATVAYATEQANIELAGADSASDLSAMHAVVVDDHALLITDWDALANRKLVERGRADAARGTQGYRTIVTSTLVLVALFREFWAVVSHKTPVTVADLGRVERSAQRMLQRLNEREQGASRLPAADLHARAVSKLMRTYGEIRRMLTYVRWWNGDADSIAPSLWSGRRGKRRARVADPVDSDLPVDDEDAEPPMPSGPVNGGPPFTS